MKISKKYPIILIISVVCQFCLNCSLANANIHVFYQNKKNPKENIELYLKKGHFRVNSTNGVVKIVNLIDETLILYKNDSEFYTSVKIKEFENRNSKKSSKSDDLFNPKLLMQNKKKLIHKIQAVLFQYSSEMDPDYSLYCAGKFDVELINQLRSALATVHETGIEILKSPPYYYALKNGLLPLKISSKSVNWEATKIDEDEISDDMFKAPVDKKFISEKEYFHKIVEHVYKELESEVTR